VRRWSRTGRCARDRGAVLFLSALILPVLLVITSIGVYLGMQRALRRTMQARADVIALDLSRYLDGSSANALRASSTTAIAKAESANRNNIDPAKVTVDWGNLNAANKFVSGTTGSATAVKVTTTGSQRRFFQAVTDGTATRSAVATSDAYAGFTIGSKLVSVDTNQALLLNGLLNKVLKTNLSLNAATWQGLVGSAVNLGQLATGLGFGSPAELAAATVNAKQFYLVAANVLQSSGYTAAASLFNTISTQTAAGLSVPVGKLLQVDAGGGNKTAVGAGLDAFNLLQGSVYAVNGTNTIDLPGLGLNLLNITTVDVSLKVTEKPRFIFGRAGTSISTQQAQLTLTPTVSVVPDIPGLVGVSLTGKIPVTASVAGATGTLQSIDCGTTKGITLGVSPQPVGLSAGLDLDLNAKVLFLPVPVASIDINATASASGTSNGGTFAYPTQFLPPVGTGTMLAAPSTSLGLAGLLNVSSANITLLGLLPLNVGNLLNPINAALGPVLGALDTAIMGPISHALGLDLGGSDIGALDMTCGTPILAG
jgi:uncharacterized membrane protein